MVLARFDALSDADPGLRRLNQPLLRFAFFSSEMLVLLRLAGRPPPFEVPVPVPVPFAWASPSS